MQLMRRLILLILLLVSPSATLAGCSLAVGTTDSQQHLTVFAAASLADAFTEIARQFETNNPSVKVILNIAGSQQLVHQISQGAPADVFASADNRQMMAAISTGRIEENSPQIFAFNRLIVVYPAENPARLSELNDLSRAGQQLVLAAPEVPAGQYVLAFLNKAVLDASFSTSFKREVLDNVVSYEENVRAVLSKVELGEADAGIVYRSDTHRLSPADIGRIEIPEHLNVVASYPIAPIKDSSNTDMTRRFIDYVMSPAGQDVLARHGFDTVMGAD